MSAASLASFSLPQISDSLGENGLALDIASYRVRVKSDLPELLAEPLSLLYRDYRAAIEPSGFIDLDLRLMRKRVGWRRYEVEFSWDGQSPISGLPENQVHPLFEWGLNWCISNASGEDAVVHAAVLERNGKALILPGDPGSGKSTLCAELSLTGWRLLSDELAIIRLDDGLVRPMPRPISLKDNSIRIIRERHPDIAMTRPIGETRKGTVAYIRPTPDAVHAWEQLVPIAYVLCPKYTAGQSLAIAPLQRSQTLSRLLENIFNVGLLGMDGFRGLAHSLVNSAGYEASYGDLDEVASWIDANCR